ncbi:MAG: WbqC family protein [Burkholderiales bacterium]|nr:WbqC family protein [Burkholderiales bacterium]
MAKTVVIHQPDFRPYVGFFDRSLQTDIYLILDHVQFVNGTSKAWTHRDRIKTPKGGQWLALSVKKSPRDTPINEVELSSEVDWRSANLRLIDANYSRAPFYREVMPYIEQLYATPAILLADFNIKSIALMMELLDVVRPMVRSSELAPVGSSNELLIDLLRKLGASHYLSGVGARAYMNEQMFLDNGIQVVWQQFNHPVYPQQFGEFEPYLSAIDMLLNCGIEQSRRLLREKA